MSEAPESVVRAVMEALGCERESVSAGLRTVAQCQVHPYVDDAFDEWAIRGCSEAVTAADAAWAAAYPEVLRQAADQPVLLALRRYTRRAVKQSEGARDE